MNEQERKEKFTPGPWKAHTTLNADWVMTDWIECVDQENICDLSHSNGGNDVYLIAAAPEMYDALKYLMDALDFALSNAERVPDCIVAVAQDAMEKAEAAQKKARGEE